MHIKLLTLVWKAQQNGGLILVSHCMGSQVGSGSADYEGRGAGGKEEVPGERWHTLEKWLKEQRNYFNSF